MEEKVLQNELDENGKNLNIEKNLQALKITAKSSETLMASVNINKTPESIHNDSMNTSICNTKNGFKNKCPVCNNFGNKLCQGCHEIYYCSIEHQKEHWKQHKSYCCPYVLKETPEFGRHLVASRNLKPGAVIIQELPISYGPRIDYSNSNIVPACLSCCKLMSGIERNTCSKCRWPICSSACAKAKEHADNECLYFKKNKIKYNPNLTSSSNKSPISPELLYRGILILRIILKKEALEKSTVWSNQLNNLQFERADGSQKYYMDKNIMIFFRTLFKLNSNKLSDFEEWNKLNGIIEVNSYYVIRSENEQEEPSRVQLLFVKSSLLSHSCVPNCSWGVAYSPNFTMKVRAAKSIKKGEIISVSYNQDWNYYGTPTRKEMILETAGFNCSCERCSESNINEFGTFMSALKCNQTQCSGYLLQELETKSIMWTCTNSNCSNRIPDDNLNHQLKTIENELNKIQSICSNLPSPVMGVGLFDDFSRRYSQVLHPNHWILQQVSRFIVGVQGGQLLKLELKQLNQFIQKCNYLLNIYDVLAPGISLDRALLQMYLSRAMYLLYCEKYETSTKIDVIKEDTKEKYKILSQIQELQEEAWLYWKDDIQTKPLNEELGFEAQSLQIEMMNILTKITNL